MRLKAITSFSGLFSMTAGEVREVSDLPLAADLLKSGLAVDLDEAARKAKEKIDSDAEKEEKPRKKKGAKL